MRIATWNLNTWINRKNGISNDQLWAWADEHLEADIVVFTEAATPPPKTILDAGWSVAHRPGGFPNRSNWGTLVAARGMRVELLTQTTSNHALDRTFPGSLTAATVWNGTELVMCVVGLYLPYRKDAKKDFIGHPTSDLASMKDDFEALLDEFGHSIIVAGDLNVPYTRVPEPLNQLGFVDPFRKTGPTTYRQDWDHDGLYTIDYIYVTKGLKRHLDSAVGGIEDFPTAFDVSDHAPLVVDLDL